MHQSAAALSAHVPPAAARLDVRLHHGAEAIDRLAVEWHALLCRLPAASAFSTPGWARAWWQTYGRHHEAVILDVRDGDRLVALLPLQISHIRGAGIRVLEMLGGSPPDWRIWVRNPHGLGFKYVNELLVEPGYELLALDALRDLLGTRAVRWDAMRLCCVPEESALARHFEGVARGWSPRQVPFARLCVDTDRGWEDYRASLSRRQRQDTRYKPNELTRAVGAELRIDSLRGVEAAAAVEEFIELFERRWTARGKPGLLSGEGDMYRNLVREEPSLVVFRLLGGNRVLASQLGFDDGRRYTPYNYAFDPDLSDKSPSHVLTQMIIEQCCGDGHTSIEQLTVAMGRHWSKQEQVTLTLEATRPAAVSRLRAGALRTAGSLIRGAQTTTAGHRARAALARVAATGRRPPEQTA